MGPVWRSWSPEHRIPESVYAREGKSFDELWTNPMRGLDQMEVVPSGFPQTRRVIHWSSSPGWMWWPSARITASSWGSGWAQAYGATTGDSWQGQHTGRAGSRPWSSLAIRSWPSLPTASSGGSELQHVTFLFREHRAARFRASTPCAAVYVGGYDEPEEVPLHRAASLSLLNPFFTF